MFSRGLTGTAFDMGHILSSGVSVLLKDHQPSHSGFSVLDRFRDWFKADTPASLVAQRIGQLLPQAFGERTSVSDSAILRELIRKAGTDEILTAARAKHDARMAELRGMAENLFDHAEADERRARTALVREPSNKTLRAWMDARHTAQEAESTADDLRAAVAEADADFLASPSYAEALGAALRNLSKVARQDDRYTAWFLALRCDALAEFVKGGTPEAGRLANDLLNGKTAPALPTSLIPSQWTVRGTPSGWRWDGSSLVPV